MDEYEIPEIRQLCPNFDNAHRLVEDIKNELYKFGLKNNEADFDMHWKIDGTNYNRLGAKLRPDGGALPGGAIMSTDGITPASVYHLKDGNRTEI